ncbi:MAG: LPS export ABC transporter periplasmic protein LptC [Bacteroidota bacterium]
MKLICSLKFHSFILFLLLCLVSCSKAPKTEDFIQVKENAPIMSARNIDVLFSDSGKIQARLTSPLMNRYTGENSLIEFPNGFKVFMFDSVNQISSTITGNRGVRREYSRIMEAWGNVIVRSEKKNEQLNTEHLIWDENKHKIWSDVKVKITRPDNILNGTSMESNESFTRYTIQNFTGQMNVKGDSI